MSEIQSSRVRIGIVGAGYVSKHHIRALQTLDFVDVVGIADIDRAAAQSIADQFAIPVVGTSLAELQAAKPQAIYVLTPPSTHCRLALEALDMGCDVLVEKPMAERAEDCDAMIARARERGRLLSVNHSDRLDPVVLAALQKVREGVCGDLIAVDVIRGSEYAPFAGGPRRGPHRQGSYPFQDIGSHGLYLIEAFLGPIADLQVDYRSIAGATPLFDDWVATARCEKGIGRMHLSWVSRPMQSRLIIQGTRGCIEVDRFTQTITVNKLLPGPKFIGIVLNAFFGSLRRAGAVAGSVIKFATGRLSGSPGIHTGAVEFALAVHERRQPIVSAEEGRRNVAIMDTASRRADADADEVFAARLRPLPPADVLVTGAGGFLGSAVTRRLIAEGRQVRVLVRRVPGWLQAYPNVQIVIGDLGDPDIVAHAIAGVHTVYHVGAAMRGSPEQFQAGTIVGARNIIDSCLAHGSARLVYVSSLGILDHAGRLESTTIDEGATQEPYPERRGAYTQTKLRAEREVLEAIRTRGLRAVVLRPGQIFGSGAERVPPNGVIALAGRWILVGNGRRSLPLVYVDDVVDGLLLAASTDAALGRVFNLVDPAVVTQSEYLAACRHKLGASLRVARVPTWFMRCIAAGVEVLGRLLKRELPLSLYRVASLRPLANFDHTAARSVLGWTPRVGAMEGLRRTYGFPDDAPQSRVEAARSAGT